MFTLNCNGRLLLIDKPVAMGIINITPDSFYKGSSYKTPDKALQAAEKMLRDGAVFLDIGGQSTKPKSERITASEEEDRILPVIEAISKNFPQSFISVDTYSAQVAANAVASGACVINDISGGTIDEKMLAIVGNLSVPYICLHIKGKPETMQQNPTYKNVTTEVLDFLIKQTEKCRLNNIHDIIIDPGLGFGKTSQHNFQLLKELSTFKMLDKLIMVGISRKSTIYKTLNTTAEESLNGTTVLNTIALLNGANILRVHDVKPAMEAIELVQAYSSYG